MNIDWKEIFEKSIVGIMDCLEECIDTITIVAGRKLINVFFCTLCFLILSLGLFILKFPVFITWRKSLTAVTIMGIICGMNYINKTCINTIIKRIQNKKGDLQNERGQ
ncbi:MAG: hypothetical protein HFI05_02195 [Lachnospiraceae bacterium]|jgi:hypothetical protein|nr:hypothetical protein [Lachnospiraceae bacterium]